MNTRILLCLVSLLVLSTKAQNVDPDRQEQINAAKKMLDVAPENWKRVSEAKDVSAKGITAKRLGVWKSPDTDLQVEVDEFPRMKDAQDVRNLIGGAFSGLSKANQTPTAAEVQRQQRYLSFWLHGKAIQNGITYSVDTCVVFARANTYMVKAFRPNEDTGFSFKGWNFGEPLTDKQLANVLDEIRAKLVLASPRASGADRRQ